MDGIGPQDYLDWLKVEHVCVSFIGKKSRASYKVKGIPFKKKEIQFKCKCIRLVLVDRPERLDESDRSDMEMLNEWENLRVNR